MGKDLLNLQPDIRNIFIEEYNIMFIFNPKVASSSIWTFAAFLLGYTNIESKSIKLPSLPVYSIQDYPEVRKIIFLRNPWDRLLSCYLQKKSMHKLRFYERNNLNIEMTFEEFVEAVSKIPDYMADVHFRSQFTCLADCEGRIIVDFIGEFSNIKEDLPTLCQRFNLPHFPLPHLNKTTHKSFREYYTPAMIDMVAKRYKIDISLFGYEFSTDKKGFNLQDLKNKLNKDLQLEIVKYKARRHEYLLKIQPRKTNHTLRFLLYRKLKSYFEFR